MARASVISFQGTFLHDDDAQLIDFTLTSTTSIELMTWSYGGGVNGNGDVIAPGGFDPYLSVFDAAGLEMLDVRQDDGVCPPQNPGNGNCYDADISISLPAGDYILALTESGNFANGPTFADGFSASGTGDFTGGPFLDIWGDQQDGHWALDLREVDSASVPSEVPEPGWLAGGGLVLLALGSWRRRLN
jgi:hypothetical protein